jgi:hypothetical protein
MLLVKCFDSANTSCYERMLSLTGFNRRVNLIKLFSLLTSKLECFCILARLDSHVLKLQANIRPGSKKFRGINALAYLSVI